MDKQSIGVNENLLERLKSEETQIQGSIQGERNQFLVFQRYLINKTMKEMDEAKKLEIDKLLSPDLCLKRGGHYWNRFDRNNSVNALGVMQSNISLLFASSEQYRICGICGTKQILIPEKWETIENKKLEELKQVLKKEINE